MATAPVTALGTGSGLDLEGLLTKLMTAESAPLTALQKQQTSYTAKISAFGSLQSVLSNLQTAAVGLKANVGQSAMEKFASYSASSSDTTVATGSAAAGAVAGDYALNVTQLAQAQRFVSAPSSATTPLSFSAGDTLTFNFATPDASGNSRNTTITLDSTNNSLTGLRNAINSANIGVSATIISGTAGDQLVFSGATGAANKITLGGTLASQMTQATGTDALDALYTVNGIASNSASNTSSAIATGVTANLAKLGTSTITVASDYSTNLTKALNTFISAYNSANSTMATMGAYNATTKVAGSLQGNGVLRDAQSQTRSLLFGTTSGGTSSIQSLTDLGVIVGADGSLSLDSAKLSKALTTDTGAVTNLVSKIGTAFNTSLDKIVGYSGKIKIATDSANTMVKELTKRQDTLQLRLDAIQTRYRAQFSALDTLVSKFNSTASYLTQQLSSLTSTTSK